MDVWVPWLLLTCALATLSLGCGVTQHNLIAHRAMLWFDPSLAGGAQYEAFAEVLANNQGAFQNGAAFPDWGYACFHSDESEAAHWPPFTLHSARFLRSSCGIEVGNWTSNCQQLGAFLFGVVAHQVADIPWHDLTATYPSRQGFIQEMANIDFEGDYSTAHTIADTGAEFVIAREFDLSFIVAEWDLPVDALVSIYASMGYNLEPTALEACNVLLYAEVHAIKYFGDLLYPYAARRSVFLTDQQLNYWSGGMDANAAWVVNCWQEYLEYWLSPADSPPLTYPICLMQQPIFDTSAFPTVAEPSNRFSTFKDHPFVREMAEFMLDNDVVTVSHDTDSGMAKLTVDSGAATSVRSEAVERMESSGHIGAGDTGDFSMPAPVSSTPYDVIHSESSYSYFGHSLASTDVNGDGVTDLIVGAPGYTIPGQPQLGAVYAVISGSNGTTGEPQLLLTGKESMARFGWAVTTADFNADGMEDIVVGSPMSTAADLTYEGKVEVFFGKVGGFSTEADVTIVTERNYTNLGFTLLGADLNGDGVKDIAIGCPFAGSGTGDYTQAGRVFAFLSSASVEGGTVLDAESDSSWVLDGSSSSSWFGYALDVASLKNNTVLLVGAPNHSGQDICTGMLYGYATDVTLAQEVAAPLFSISGSTKWDMVGFSMATGAFDTTDNALAFGLPNRDERGWQREFMGAVGVVDFSSLSGVYNVDDLDFVVYLEGDEEYARFGWRVTLAPDAYGKDCLWVSQPRRSTNAGKESGVVYSFTSRDTTTTIASGSGLSRMGESMFVWKGSTNTMVLGAPRFNSTLEGAVVMAHL